MSPSDKVWYVARAQAPDGPHSQGEIAAAGIAPGSLIAHYARRTPTRIAQQPATNLFLGGKASDRQVHGR